MRSLHIILVALAPVTDELHSGWFIICCCCSTVSECETISNDLRGIELKRYCAEIHLASSSVCRSVWLPACSSVWLANSDGCVAGVATDTRIFGLPTRGRGDMAMNDNSPYLYVVRWCLIMGFSNWACVRWNEMNWLTCCLARISQGLLQWGILEEEMKFRGRKEDGRDIYDQH